MATNREKLPMKTVVEQQTLSSVANSTRKLLSSARKPLVVRQTLTSKLRAERGSDAYYKTKLQQLTVLVSRDTSLSKESLKLNDEFKKPQASKARMLTPAPKLLNSGVKSAAKPNLTSVFKTPARVYKPNETVKTVKKTNNEILASRSMNVHLPKQTNSKVVLQQRPQKENFSKSTDTKLPKTKLSSTPLSKTIGGGGQIERQSLTTKHKQNATKSSNLPKLNGVPKVAVSTCNRSFLLKNIESVKKLSNRTDPTRKPRINNTLKPKTSQLKNPAELKCKKSNVELKTVTVKSPLRKSLSAMHFRKVSNLNRNSTIHRAQSLATFVSFRDLSLGVAPIAEDHEESIVFKTPSVAKRRSVAFLTPMSTKKSISSPFVNGREPCPFDLRRRLQLWLETKGKPLGSYHHLRCFDVQARGQPADEENKENIEEPVDVSASYTDLSIATKETGVDPLMTANAALFDLQCLIQDEYPRDQCDAWLNVIRNKYGELEEGPEYWECRAALEESWGNFTSAVDCYKKAIVKGAEVRNVDECLENLLQKFSVLNISPVKTASVYRGPANAALEAKNVFKSSIISFAIQERSKRRSKDSEGIKSSSKFVATPVRRSTRRTRSGYVCTQGVTLCPSLKDLDSSIGDSLEFKVNRALH